MFNSTMNKILSKDRIYILAYIFVGAIILLFLYWITPPKSSNILDDVAGTENILGVQYRVEHMYDIAPAFSWKTYHSELLGITFRYPPDMLVREYRNGDGVVGMLSGSIELYPDTSEVEDVLQEKNPDTDSLPPGIFFARSVAYEEMPRIEDIAQTTYITEHGYEFSDVMGMQGIVTWLQGIDSVDNIIFVRDMYLYEASVAYVSSNDKRRDDFYAILSSFVFDEK